MGKVVKFKEWTCEVRQAHYGNGRIALELYNHEGSIAIATVNCPHVEIPSDCIVVKNYSENEGMLEALQEAGIVGGVVGHIHTGFVIVPVCEYLGLD